MTDPQLQSARFCSRCGATLTTRTVGGRIRPACPGCGFVVYVDPKVASAALVVRDGRVLLVRRRNEPGRGLWCLPCGYAEADEPPDDAARREAREETGLDVTVGRLLGAYHYTDDPRGAGILLVYLARDEGATPLAGDDAEAVGFFALDALPPLSHHTHVRALADWAMLVRDGDRS
ncbi:MAG: NUDIX hydrolase [Chloroflexi bacterium]|nr:NUDIX hydrolase [Chloroflexota bacterium]